VVRLDERAVAVEDHRPAGDPEGAAVGHGAHIIRIIRLDRVRDRDAATGVDRQLISTGGIIDWVERVV